MSFDVIGNNGAFEKKWIIERLHLTIKCNRSASTQNDSQKLLSFKNIVLHKYPVICTSSNAGKGFVVINFFFC